MTFSRRAFLLGLGAIISCPPAWSARKPKVVPQVQVGGPRTIARQEWPPAISPEYVGIVDKGYACFADDMGRIAVVDLKREDNPAVLGELFGLGRRVLGVAITPYSAFALAQVEVGAETQHFLTTVSLSPPTDLSVMSKIPLDMFAEPTCIAASSDLIAVGGLGASGERKIALFAMPRSKGKSVEPSLVATMPFDLVPVKMDLQERMLLVIAGTDNSDLLSVNVANPRSPELVKSIRLGGAFSSLARHKELVITAGRATDGTYQAKLFSLKPSLTSVRDVTLKAVTEVLDVSAQRGQFLILVASAGGRQSVLPVTVGKKASVTAGSPVLLPQGKGGSSPRAHIAVKNLDAYIASDWGGVQVLNVTKEGWQFSYSHTIPRLPASAVVLQGNRAVLACADLKVYDLSTPSRPLLLESAEVGGVVRSMMGVGRSVLCLSRDTLSIRPIEKLTSVLAQARASGVAMALDRAAGRVYIISPSAKGTTITPGRVTEESLRMETPFDVPVTYRRGCAAGNRLLLAGLSDVGLYNADGTEELGRRNMPNFAIRDFVLTPTACVLACVDENLKGHLVTLGLPDLNLLGSTDLPADAAALAFSGSSAVVVGRDGKGKDSGSIVNLADLAMPKVVESFSVLEAASAVTIGDKMAIIAGRGLEIISLA